MQSICKNSCQTETSLCASDLDTRYKIDSLKYLLEKLPRRPTKQHKFLFIVLITLIINKMEKFIVVCLLLFTSSFAMQEFVSIRGLDGKNFDIPR